MVDLVLAEVRSNILNGTLAGGAELSITELSSRFGISHIPVREALRRLDSEGLVQLRRARTAIVSPVSVDDLRKLYRLRASIEGDLATLAAGHHTPQQLDEMRSLLEKLELNDGQEPSDGAHVAFHALVVEPAASTWDWRVLDVLWRASERYLAIVIGKIRVQEGPSGIRDRHLPILDAASAGDPELLRAAVVEHLDSGVQILGELLGDALGGEPAHR